MSLLQSYKSVLVVDDNLIDRLITAKVLEKMQLFTNIQTFSSGAEALAYLTQTSKSGQNPELILLDVDMPLMNGFQFLEQCRAQKLLVNAVTKVIFLSSSMHPTDQQRAASLSVEGYLHKPLTMERLGTVLKPK